MIAENSYQFSLNSYQITSSTSLSQKQIKKALFSLEEKDSPLLNLYQERKGRQIYRFQDSLCLKVYLQNPFQSQKAWRAAQKLINLNLPTPLPLFWAQSPHRGIFATPWVAETRSWPLYFIDIEEGKEQRKFLEKIANLLVRLHHQGIFHSDLSHWNLLADSGGKLWLVDLEEISFLPRVGWWKKIKNLVQILCPLEEIASLGESRHFFFQYLSHFSHLTPLRSPFLAFLRWRAHHRFRRLRRRYRLRYNKDYTALG